MTDYPNVPDVPGVPTIPRDPNNPIPQPQLATGDSVTSTGYSNLPKWGIFLDGSAALTPDNFGTFDYRQDWAIADYQITDGGFESYDKVSEPFDLRLMISQGGALEDRADFLTAVQNMVGDLKLYDIITPETTYSSCNVAHWDYRRTNTDGVGLLKVNLYFTQIRITASQQFSQTNTSPASQSNVQDPGAAAKVNDGVVPTNTVTTSQQTDVNASLLPLNLLGTPITLGG